MTKTKFIGNASFQIKRLLVYMGFTADFCDCEVYEPLRS